MQENLLVRGTLVRIRVLRHGQDARATDSVPNEAPRWHGRPACGPLDPPEMIAFQSRKSYPRRWGQANLGGTP